KHADAALDQYDLVVEFAGRLDPLLGVDSFRVFGGLHLRLPGEGREIFQLGWTHAFGRSDFFLCRDRLAGESLPAGDPAAREWARPESLAAKPLADGGASALSLHRLHRLYDPVRLRGGGYYGIRDLRPVGFTDAPLEPLRVVVSFDGDRAGWLVVL